MVVQSDSRRRDMASIARKSFDEPEEVASFAGGRTRSDRLRANGHLLRRVTIQPGWRFREHSAPERGTKLCEDFHVKIFLAGHFAMDVDGKTEIYGPGDVAIVSPHHDAWVVGDEPSVFIDLADWLGPELEVS
jgi:quercetin dioxygenase-like cupin family protein